MLTEHDPTSRDHERQPSFAVGSTHVAVAMRPGTVERFFSVLTIFVLFFGLPNTWFVTREALLGGEATTSVTTAVTLGLVLLGALRILGSIDLVIRAVRMEPWLLFFVVYLFSTAFWSVNPYLTSLWATLLVAGTVYAVYLFLRYDLHEVLEMLSLAALMGGLISLTMVLAAPQYGVTAGAGTSWIGVFSQKNALGFSAALVIPTMLIVDRASPRWRWIARLNLLIFSVLLVGSESKTMLLATAISVCLLVFYQAFRSRRTLRGAVMLALAGSSAFTVAFATANLAIIAGWLERDITLTGRTVLWESLLGPIGDGLFFGYGYNVAFTEPLGPLFEVIVLNDWGVSHAHNAGFQLLLDGGIIALASYLWIYLRGVSNAIEVTRRVPGALGSWPLAYLSTVLLVSLTEPGVTQGGPGWLLFVLAILYARTYRDGPIVTTAGRPGLRREDRRAELDRLKVPT